RARRPRRGVAGAGGCGDRPSHVARFGTPGDPRPHPRRRRARAAGARAAAVAGGRRPHRARDQRALRGTVAARLCRARAAAVTMIAFCALVALQGVVTVTPTRPTVGDTVWIAWTVAAPAGWRVRPGPLTADATLAPLGDPVATRTADGWLVRYPVALWTPGAVAVPLPTLWRSGPNGSGDSVPGPVASLTVASVLPDSGRPAPRPALAPLRESRPGAWPVVLAVALAAGLLAGGVAWRRRGPAAAAPAGEPAAA